MKKLFVASLVLLAACVEEPSSHFPAPRPAPIAPFEFNPPVGFTKLRLGLVPYSDPEALKAAHAPLAACRTLGTMMPLLALSGAPMMVVGVVFGAVKVTTTQDTTLGTVGAIAAGIFLVGALITFTVSALAVFDDWAQQAATACDRAARARELRTERHELSVRL